MHHHDGEDGDPITVPWRYGLEGYLSLVGWLNGLMASGGWWASPSSSLVESSNTSPCATP